MPLNREQKEEQVSLLVEKMKEAKSIVFANYSDIPMTAQNNLRNTLREGKAELKVAKKTLIKVAAKELGIEEISDEILSGQIVAAFSYDEPTVGPQAIKKMSKDLKSLKLLGGIFDGKVLDLAQVTELADLPPKEVLYAKLLGSMMSPVSGFVGTSSNVISGFVRVLNAHKENLEKA